MIGRGVIFALVVFIISSTVAEGTATVDSVLDAVVVNGIEVVNVDGLVDLAVDDVAMICG